MKISNLKGWTARLLGLGIVLAILISGCASSDSEIVVQEGSCQRDGTALHLLDRNRDGKVQIGVATPGPRDDGAYYQALVETAREISKEQGFAEVVVVDEISEAEAETALENLATQCVDMIAVGGTDIAGPLPVLTEKYPNIFWYCNCGAGFQELPGLAQSKDDSSEINYTAGIAAGLILQREPGKDEVLFLGCCDLGFERESFKAFELGLKEINSNYRLTYIGTGRFPFDFNNVSGSIEALNLKIGDIGAVYPFLGEAHEPVIQRANEEGIATLSAGASDVCTRSNLEYDIAVRFDAGDYLETVLSEIISGDLRRGQIRVFRVGIDEAVGAIICTPTADELSQLNAAYRRVANGELSEEFAEIKNSALPG